MVSRTIIVEKEFYFKTATGKFSVMSLEPAAKQSSDSLIFLGKHV